MMKAQVSNHLRSHKFFTMIRLFMILAVSVSTCVANAFDETDYGNEAKDVSLRIPQQQQQQPFNFENLQRLRARFQEDAHYRNDNANNFDKNENNGKTYPTATGRRLVTDPLSKDQDKNSDQKPQRDNQPKFNEMEFYDELESNIPYGIQNVRRDLTSRSSRSQTRLHKPKHIQLLSDTHGFT